MSHSRRTLIEALPVAPAFPVPSSLWVISDTHLFSDDDPCAKSLQRTIDSDMQAGDVLVLAGDLFDLFVSDKNLFLTRHEQILAAWHRAAERGVKIHIIEGNHDFLLEGLAARIPGALHHARGVRLDLGGRQCWIEHGDLANPLDVGYLALRAAFRSLPFRWFARATPASVLDWIGRMASRTSRGGAVSATSVARTPDHLPSREVQDLRRIYRTAAAQHLLAGADIVIFGHCHDRDEIRFRIANREVQYINMGFPPVHGSILHWRPGAPFVERFALPVV